nr:uncharacterized protein LOC112281075 isoform X2 [Physcomitrium patens]|eukprot:XP_024373014.1 uncharacterized protein LOC112281075 isoform X2 [Physcomitrella patens]
MTLGKAHRSSAHQSKVQLRSCATMSCGGCGCCPKCGCQATCTCNQSIWLDFESYADFSGVTGATFTGAEIDISCGSLHASSQSIVASHGGKCVNCGWHAPGGCA